MSLESFPLIDLTDDESLRAAVSSLNLLAPDEVIEAAAPAGDGNMNLVTRVVTSRGSFIVKQSRPWVERFPDIAAPADRILAELDFYERVGRVPRLAARMPRLLGCDLQQRLLAIEDLGAAKDYSHLYSGDTLNEFPLKEVLSWLAPLHDLRITVQESANVGNWELRKLNHAHLFEIPFQTPPAMDLDAICPGLSALASSFQQDERSQKAAARLGERYLNPPATGNGQPARLSLLHGDFYPGSWLRNDAGTWIIDPEFCFVGDPEFDLAVLAAHYLFCGGQPASIDEICHLYAEQRRDACTIDRELLAGWIGVELIRRLLGVAQLPLVASLQQRAAWLTTARELIIG